MTYRKIEVNGKQYEYVIGSKCTKIKGIGAWFNKAIGNPNIDDETSFIVTPKTVAALIKGEKTPVPVRCNTHNKLTYSYARTGDHNAIEPFCVQCVSSLIDRINKLSEDRKQQTSSCTQIP